ncbi:MAG: single-stranded DNA-binding protein [Microbacteriaceae bacterium]|nr:single-stranded DNA-binding protein [Microbacteriaceae bacterium]
MTDTITLIGIVATPPRHLITNAGLAITSFRLASTQRRFDRAQEKWVDGDTNWYTVTTFRQLAYNAAVSVVKGDRVIVDGRIRVRDWQAGERSGTNIDVEADALGHDLAWGTARWVRTLGAGIAGSDPSDRHDPSSGSSTELAFEHFSSGSSGSSGSSDSGISSELGDADVADVSGDLITADAAPDTAAEADASVDTGASWISTGDHEARSEDNGSGGTRPARKSRVSASASGSFRDQEEISVPF